MIHPRGIDPDHLTREELQLFQQRALRDWRNNAWLAERNPRAFTALEHRDPEEVWMDLTAGHGEAEQLPGTIAMGFEYTPTPDGEKRARDTDVHWQIEKGIPAEARTIDRAYLGRKKLSTATDMLLDQITLELGRTIVPNGLVVLRDTPTSMRALATRMEEVGFIVEGTSEGEMRLRLVAARTRLEDMARGVDHRVYGERKSEAPRQPSSNSF